MDPTSSAKPNQQARRGKQSTQREVAQLAGVSIMTVSNVINGRHHMMARETREAVEAAIAKLHYRPDSVGRGLRISRRFSIGVMVVDPSPTFVADHFTTYIVAGLSNRLSKEGYGLLLQGVSSERLVDLASLRAGGTDAICVVMSGKKFERKILRERLAELAHPFIVIQDDVPEVDIDAMSIRQDDLGGGRMLASHLISRGSRKLLFLCEQHPWPALENRLHGVEEIVRKSQSEASVEVVKAATANLDDVQASLAAYVGRHGLPDAVIGGNDQIGIGCLLWLQSQGVRVPDQVKVTGFNAFEFARFAIPKLTTIRSAAYEIGDLAAASVLERLERGSFLSRERVLPVALEEGGST